MRNKILVIEDSIDYQIIINVILKDEFDLFFAKNANESMSMIANETYDLILIDIVLPDISGYQICSFIKSQKHLTKTPIILVTSKDTIEDKTIGFTVGADDYITKPFHHKELYLRVKARLNQNSINTNIDQINLSNLQIDLQKQRARILSENKFLDLTRLEFKLLVFFSERLDLILTRQQILDCVWPNNLNISERTIDSHISNLRKKLGGLDFELRAISGIGYRFSICSSVGKKNTDKLKKQG